MSLIVTKYVRECMQYHCFQIPIQVLSNYCDHCFWKKLIGYYIHRQLVNLFKSIFLFDINYLGRYQWVQRGAFGLICPL